MIARNGRPIAQVSALARPDLVFGGMAGEVAVDDDAFRAADAEVAAMWSDAELR